MDTNAVHDENAVLERDAAPEERPPRDPRRWWALGALVLAVLVIGFDVTILNVALPSMAAALGAGTSALQWIVDAYIVVFAAGMLPAGLLADRYGRRRVLTAGLAVFALASAFGALATTTGEVIAARAAMGVGGAVIMPVSIAIMPSIFPAEERSRAIAAWTAGSAVALPIGPFLGGWLLQHYWWGSVFLLNVPVVGVALAAAVTLLPESKNPDAPRVSFGWSALSVAGLAALVLGVIEGPSWGWSSPGVVAALAGGAAGTALFARGQLRAARPIVELRIFKHRGFRWGSVLGVFVSFVMGGVIFVVPQYLQSVAGFDALGSGLRLAPMMGGLLVGATLVDRIVPRTGARPIVALGLVAMAAATFLGATTSVGEGYGHTALWLTMAGAGVGLSLVPVLAVSLKAVPDEQAGAGSALLQTLRQVGTAFGIAALGALLASRFTADLHIGANVPATAAHAAQQSVVAAQKVAAALHDGALAASAKSAFVSGMDAALIVCGAGALVGAALALLFLPRARAGTAV
jgi:EmrB/QacA subfamily drug resistance transporter